MAENPFDAIVANDTQADSANPFDAIVQSDLAQQAKSSVAQSAEIDPDQDAKLQQFAKKYGLPLTAVRLDPVKAKRQERIDTIDYASLAQDTPSTAGFLGEPENAAVAHDDIATMTELERQFGVLKAPSGPKPGFMSTVKGLAQSAKTGVELTKAGIKQQVADLFGFEDLSKQAQLEAERARFRQSLVDPAFESSTGQGLYGGGKSLIQMVPGVAGALVTRNPSIAIGAAGVQTETDAYTKYRARGATPGEAFTGASGEGAVEVITEKLPMSFLVDSLGKTGAGKFMMEYFVKEGLTEQAAALAQDAIDTAIANPDKTWGDYIKERPDAAYQTLLGTLVASGTFAGANVAAQRLATKSEKAQAAEHNTQVIEQITKLAEASKLRERSPDAFAAFIEKATQNSEVQDVYVSAAVLAQSGVDVIGLMGVSPSVAEQFAGAQATGGDVRIPVSEFASKIAGTEFAQPLIDHLKTDPNGMSRLEAQEFMQSEAKVLEEEVNKVLEEKKGDEKFKASRQVVFDNVLGQLTAANRFTADVNTPYATLMANFYAVQGARLGITPEEMFAKYPVQIKAESVGGQQLDQITREQALATNVPLELPTDENFTSAVANTPGAEITPEGLKIDLVRYQKMEQEGGRAIRTGVFYLPWKSKNARHYRNAGTANNANNYGGTEEFRGETLIRRPLFVKGATGGKAPEAAFDAINGKGAMKQLDKDVMSVVTSRSALKDRALFIENVGNLFEKYGADRQLAWDVVDASQKGNQLRYALQENIIAHAVRKAGYDAVVGYSKGKQGPSISEVFDVREQTYPARGMDSEVHGAFDPNILNQSQPQFTSAVEQAASVIKQEKGSGDQFLAQIKNTAGVKEEEISWLGLDEFLKGKKSVTKQEVMDFIAQNKVQMEEVTLQDNNNGGLRLVPNQEESDYAGEPMFDVVDSEGNTRYTGGQQDSLNYMEEESQLAPTRNGTATKFDQYTLPGGENYREVLLTLPSKVGEAEGKARYALDARSKKEPWDSLTEEDKQKYIASAGRRSGEYRSSHFDQPNILAHVRLNDRVDADGKKVLFVEEIQSDWHQAGRKKGYKTELTAEQEARADELNKQFREALDKRDIARKEDDVISEGVLTKKIADIRAELDTLQKKVDGVPDAPFKKTWHELAFKRILQEAVAKGYDRVAWTTGEQQAERYDLSHQVDELRLFNRGDGTWDISAMKKEPDRRGGRLVDIATAIPQDKLADNIGKEMAKKAVEQQTEKGWKTYTGVDLKVGGEGMKGFYDKIIPDYAKKLGKKYGAKVGETKLGSDQKSYDEIIQELQDFEKYPTGSAEREALKAQLETAPDTGHDSVNATVHSLDITPELRAAVEGGLPLFQGNDTKRGSFNPSTSTITLLKAADLSTFLHEAGHFFLETMNTMALDPNAPQEIKDDMDAVLRWFGVPSIEEWNAKTLDEQRPHHEKFARGFEAYLFEGKSPNVEMQGVFQRFAAWLLNVYKSLKALNVELNDEVRSVFDRMLASREQIKEAEAARSMLPLFVSAEDAGMTPEEFKAYYDLGVQATQNAMSEYEARSLRDMQWLSNAKGRALKELQKQAKEKRKAVQREVTEEVMNEPVNLVRSFLKRRKVEGAEADAVAEQFGFTSGDEMNKALETAEKAKDKIAALTDQRMLERYGDLTDPAAMERAAEKAIHNDARTRFIATEMNALQKASGGRKIFTDAAKQYAEAMINRQKVRDVKPSRYEAAEARAAKAANDARKSGDLPLAATEKRNQLVQNYAARAAYNAIDDVEKALNYFKKFNKEGSRSKVDADYLEQIDTLLERFDLRKGQSLKAIDKRKSLAAWVAAQEDIGIEPDIDPAILNEANRKHYKDMTVEEMRGLVDTIRQIEHLGRLKNKLLTAKDARDFATTVQGLVTSIDQNSGNKVANNATRSTVGDRALRMFKGYLTSHRKLANIARELDGWKDGGAMWETFIRGMNEAGDKETTMRAEATAKLATLLAPVLKGGRMEGKGQYVKSVGRSFNRAERLAVALNTGNEGNFQRLLDGAGWTPQQVSDVLETLTEKDWDFVQSVWDFFEGYRPEIGAKEKRVYGKEPEWVEPQPVNTKFGQYRGGYYPIKYDARQSLAAEQHSAAEEAKMQMKGAYTSATTRRSFTKSRVDEVKGRPLLLTLDGLYSGVNEVIHDLAWHEWLIDANRLLRSKSLDNAVRNTYGADYVKEIKKAVEDVAKGELPATSELEQTVNNLRAGATVAGLGFNLLNSVINVSGLTQSAVRVGPKWLALGVGEWAMSPVKLVGQVHEKSAFMRSRARTMNREINEIRSLVQDKGNVRRTVDAVMFAPLTMTQLAVDTPTWWGAYQKALADGQIEDRAVALADQAVIDAQGSGMIKDLARIQRGGPWAKLFTTFYSYFSTTYNLTVEATKKTNFKDPLDIVRLGGDYLMLYVIPVIFTTAIHAAIGGEDDPEELAKMLVNNEISYLFGTMVGIRELTGVAQMVAGVNQYANSYGGPAGLRFVQELYKLAQQVGQGDLDRALTRSAINVGGILLHLPSTQANRTIDGIMALAEGKTHNPLAVITGAPK